MNKKYAIKCDDKDTFTLNPPLEGPNKEKYEKVFIRILEGTEDEKKLLEKILKTTIDDKARYFGLVHPVINNVVSNTYMAVPKSQTIEETIKNIGYIIKENNQTEDPYSYLRNFSLNYLIN